ncbi:MAG: 6-phosphogluconolactonase, partial [Planctomycetes bacterium]|nr:6-phosphogluconolactonase [Planctomycetota bacterium]
ARVAAAIEAAVAERGVATIALAGGGTPRPVYQALTERSDLPWEHVEFFFGDERCVSPDDPQSNYRMAREALLDAHPTAVVHRMEGEREDREAAADAYAAALPERLDVVLLGMGGDGHTASLFPGDEALAERERRVVVVQGPKPPPWRLTITAPVIEAARSVLVLVTGAGKANMVARALADTASVRELPIQLALNGTWFLDQDAASELK